MTHLERAAPLTLNPKVVVNKYGDSWEIDIFDAKNGSGISGVYDSKRGALFIRNVRVSPQNRGRTLGDQLYQKIIQEAEVNSGTRVQRVTGNPALDNTIGPEGPSATPRARILTKQGFNKHSYDKENDLIISER